MKPQPDIGDTFNHGGIMFRVEQGTACEGCDLLIGGICDADRHTPRCCGNSVKVQFNFKRMTDA